MVASPTALVIPGAILRAWLAVEISNVRIVEGVG
jgi:hypothetical protein